MCFINSFLIIQVENSNNHKSLNDFYFFEDIDGENSSRKFYSINFHDKEKNGGEIHYTNSYEKGNMNSINFYRKDNLFFLFTSSVQHIKFLKKILLKMIPNSSINFKIIKLTASIDVLPKHNLENFTVVEADGVYGIKGLLTLNGNDHFIKIYNNGVVMFPFTNDKELVKEVMNTSLKIINKYEGQH